MHDLAIRAESLSKRYRIGQQHSSVDTLRDHLAHGLKTLWTRGWRIPRDTIWALRDEPPLASDYLLALDRMVGLASRGLLIPADSWLLKLGRALDPRALSF